ncbi:hypothetical protein P0082_06830 [Candidatus Haliotispira prima]|uniref:Uncharacterized protein n=1 Tax=Candidatus Haliotispira prima TaxID=3034016 RepID=A0ABY8MDY2_9SPIO|nr:hypothetical protein P0082_06830 [Candidatus Haliotispira prima]
MSDSIGAGNGQYSYTRAIRLKGILQSGSLPKPNDTLEVSLEELAEHLEEISLLFEKIVFRRNEKNEQESRKGIRINKSWLKRYHKALFYLLIKNNKNRDGKYDLKTELRHVQEDIRERWLTDFEHYQKNLTSAARRPKASKLRRSEIAESVRGLLHPSILHYALDLFSYNGITTKDTEIDGQITKLRGRLETVREGLLSVQRKYLPAEATGIQVAKASFNFYTVNKKPKEYTVESLEKELYEKPYLTISIKTTKKGNKQVEFVGLSKPLSDSQIEQEIVWFEKYLEANIKPVSENKWELSLEETYKLLKAFKSQQKDIFYKFMGHLAQNKKESFMVKNPDKPLDNYCFLPQKEGQNNIDFVNSLFSLFKFRNLKKESEEKNNRFGHPSIAEENYKKFISYYKDIKEDKKERGKYLFGKNCYFLGYSKLIQKYEEIARNRGKLVAQIKGVTREKQEAEEIGYWSFIYRTSEQSKLWLVPKTEDLSALKKFLDEQVDAGAEDKEYLCYFRSLTMRALHKLCFAEGSSFAKGLSSELQVLLSELKELLKAAKEYPTTDERSRKEKKQKQLVFFKKLVQSQEKLGTLELEGFDLEKVKNSQTLQDFELALEKVCYNVRKIRLNETKQQRIISDYKIVTFDITSYDLEDRKRTGEDRRHTAIWRTFWGYPGDGAVSKVQGFDLGEVRLNPEVKIRYRQADDEWKKSQTEERGNTVFKPHRKLQEQYTLGFSFALHAGRIHEELAFAKPEDLLAKINQFNADINEKMDFDHAWRYGIDRGYIELATLCIAKFQPEKKYKYAGKDIPIPEFPGTALKAYSFKGEKYDYTELYVTQVGGKQRRAILNLSYFLEKDEAPRADLFEEESITCLDLTTAKVIKGHIITNGDVMSYLKLKKVAAKRQIYTLYHQARSIGKDDTLTWGKENELSLPGLEKVIYYFLPKYEAILSKDEIKDSLNSYLDELRRLEKARQGQSSEKENPHTPAVQEINHLRDAITANMVGVICHLQKTYSGYVMLEDLDDVKKKHFEEHQENISSRLELALYNRFQTLGFVPPHVKDILQLRKENKPESCQIGTILFVDKTKTSKDCPYCEQTDKKGEKDADRAKLVEHRFSCTPKENSCGFDTYRFKGPQDRVEGSVEVEDTDRDFSFLKEIDDPDKVAAFNVSKKIKTVKDIPPWDMSNKPEEKQDQEEIVNKKKKHPHKNIKKESPETFTIGDSMQEKRHKRR